MEIYNDCIKVIRNLFGKRNPLAQALQIEEYILL